MDNGIFYENKRPRLTIEITDSGTLGRCYYYTKYKITSVLKLSRESLEKLREAGFIGCGQGFQIDSICDGTESPAGEDELEPVEYRDGKRVNEEPINKYTGKPYEKFISPYYEYNCESRVDSGD